MWCLLGLQVHPTKLLGPKSLWCNWNEKNKKCFFKKIIGNFNLHPDNIFEEWTRKRILFCFVQLRLFGLMVIFRKRSSIIKRFYETKETESTFSSHGLSLCILSDWLLAERRKNVSFLWQVEQSVDSNFYFEAKQVIWYLDQLQYYDSLFSVVNQKFYYNNLEPRGRVLGLIMTRLVQSWYLY